MKRNANYGKVLKSGFIHSIQMKIFFFKVGFCTWPYEKHFFDEASDCDDEVIYRDGVKE